MFEIDFFREAKLKQKPHYAVVIILTLALLTPLVVASGVLTKYVANKIQLPTVKSSLENVNNELVKLLDYEQTLNTLGEERARLITTLNDVTEVVGRHIQWSEAIASLAEGVPEDVIIMNLNLIREPVKSPSGQMLRFEYKLNIGAILLGNPSSMQQFMQFLRFTWPLQTSSKNIEMLVQRRAQIEGRDFPLYLIQCSWER